MRSCKIWGKVSSSMTNAGWIRLPCQNSVNPLFHLDHSSSLYSDIFLLQVKVLKIYFRSEKRVATNKIWNLKLEHKGNNIFRENMHKAKQIWAIIRLIYLVFESKDNQLTNIPNQKLDWHIWDKEKPRILHNINEDPPWESPQNFERKATGDNRNL